MKGQRATDRVLDEVWDTPVDARNVSAFHLPKTIDPDKLPKSLRRAKSAMGFLAAWRKLRDAVWTNAGIPYKQLPAFAYGWGKLFYETHERRAYDAILLGDVMFFEAWFGRFEMMNRAAEAKGLSVVERSTILHALGILKGYGDAASKRLRDLGGTWPPES